MAMKTEVENREDMAEEIPIEEFDNDRQDFLKEFMKEFPDEAEEIEYEEQEAEDEPINQE